MAKYNVPTQPVDRELAANVVNDLWDLFGVLTRDQKSALQSYFESLTAQGILVFPKELSEPPVGSGTPAGQLIPSDPTTPAPDQK